ncbi:hypothetical protein F5Y19DRAFT_493418 [Xylariaceae sp. FL1651]|nr:hypothetical protein F5Y19DRAFT_493418 [Xylariaceae sp. FL1651]
MAFELGGGPIAGRVAQCLAAFEAVAATRAQARLDDIQVTFIAKISDQLTRFKLWAVRSIVFGESIPWDQDLSRADELGELDGELKDLLKDENFEFDSELAQLTAEVAEIIGNLLRLSMSLRHPTPHDRFMSTEYAKVRYFEANDKAHVEAKFPRASQTLIIRLGQALSQRRQYFRYRESHHEKLARGLFGSGRSKADTKSTVASSVPLARRVFGDVPKFGELDEDERSETGFSQTSFATTAPDTERLRIPPLPKKSHDGPFECPFCFMLILVSSTHQWKKHVLRDLRPYICLAENCPAANTEYGRRHDWMSHMLQKHWKSWACPLECGLDYVTETDLRQHVIRVHKSVTEMELDAMVARCSRSRSLSLFIPVKCPLCQDTLESVQQYQRHVGRHQVDLALFALPRIDDDGEEADEQDEDQETISIRSDSCSEALTDNIVPAALTKPTENITEAPEGDNEIESLKEMEEELDRIEELLYPEHRLRKKEKEAIERYKKVEAERILKEREETKERKLEYRHHMQETLITSGLDEKEINTILEGNKIENGQEKEGPPTWTRMTKRHLSLETLRVYDIDYTIDQASNTPEVRQDPEYILIKRWVPDTELDVLWRRTRALREQRVNKSVISTEDGDDKEHMSEFEWVRQKERKKSPSPSLLAYLAGERPT